MFKLIGVFTWLWDTRSRIRDFSWFRKEFIFLSGTLKVNLGTKHFKIFQMLPFEKNQLKRRDELSRIYLLDECRPDSNLTVIPFSVILLPNDYFLVKHFWLVRFKRIVLKRIVRTKAILSSKSMSEKRGSDKKPPWTWITSISTDFVAI